MQAYAQSLPDKTMRKSVSGCLHLLLQNSSYFCVIYPALDIPFPAIASRCNPRHWRRYHISLCHITILGVWQARRCSAFLGVARRSRRSRSVGSHHMQSSTATSRRRWRSYGVGEATLSHPTPLPKCSSPEHTKI